MCTSFFVDLVSTMCFKDNCPPQKDVVQVLLSLLFVQKKLLRDAPERHSEHTKSLSPFDDVVDKTPVIRSVILKLLLKYRSARQHRLAFGLLHVVAFSAKYPSQD